MASFEEDTAEETPHIGADLASFREFEVLRSDLTIERDYVVGSFSFDHPEEFGGEKRVVSLILITQINGQFLVAVPGKSWHRTRNLRFLPADSLSRPVNVLVAGVRDQDRETVEEDKNLKVWLGLLKPEFAESISFTSGLDCDHEFLLDSGEAGFVPYGDALIAVSDDRFAFMTAESGGPEARAGDTSRRLATLEESMVAIKTSLQQLLQAKTEKTPPVTPRKSALRGATPKATAVPPAESGLEGLDPQVVQSAISAGISQEHLAEFGRMIRKNKPKLPDNPRERGTPRVRLDVLGESEEEEDGAALAAPLETTEAKDPVASAVVKLTQIMSTMTSSRKVKTLEDLSDDFVPQMDSGVSSGSSGQRRHLQLLRTLRKSLKDQPEEVYRILRDRMEHDFGCPESGPGEPVRSGTWRGWSEHRSKVPNIVSSVRSCWAVSGALDALDKGRVSEAKARLALYLSQLDQVAVDRGQWILAQEASLEDGPPFSSFSKHVPPDMLEPQHSRLWPSSWAEAFMYKVKELDDFIEKRSRLGKRSGPANPGLAANEDLNRQPNPKKGDRGKGKTAETAASSSSAN